MIVMGIARFADRSKCRLFMDSFGRAGHSHVKFEFGSSHLNDEQMSFVRGPFGRAGHSQMTFEFGTSLFK